MTREQYEQRLAALCARYPYLYSGKHLEYDIAPGWLGIMETLCAQVDATLTAAEKRTVSFVQIKEKFGGLRVYVEGAPLQLDILGKGGLRLSGRFEKAARSDAFSRIRPSSMLPKLKAIAHVSSAARRGRFGAIVVGG